MIRDVAEFRRTGVVSRHVTDLDIPAAAWRAAMCHAGRRDGIRVRTFLVPLGPFAPDGPWDQLVFAVRTDPPPDRAAQNQGVLRWWRVEDLTMPFGRWRAALHRAARRENARVSTFLVPPCVAGGAGGPDQRVYVVWAAATDLRCTPSAPAGAVPRPAPQPVTDLADYRAGRLGRAGSIARHPSGCIDPEPGDRRDGDDNGDDDGAHLRT